MATQTVTRIAAGHIRGKLSARGLTQEWLSEQTGIPMRTLSRRLHLINPSPLTLEELAIIADALEESMTDLIAAPPVKAVA